MRRAIALAAVVFLVGCGKDSPAEPPSGRGFVEITNLSSRTFHGVYFKPCSTATFPNANQLVNGSTLPPNETKRFVVAPPGCTDVRIFATGAHWDFTAVMVEPEGTVDITATN